MDVLSCQFLRDRREPEYCEHCLIARQESVSTERVANLWRGVEGLTRTPFMQASTQML